MTGEDIITTCGKYNYRTAFATPVIMKNAAELARRMNMLFTSFASFSGEPNERKLTSGFRDRASNIVAHGARASAHLEGKACDVEDTNGRLALFCVRNTDLLAHFRLWIEDPTRTKGWAHLQSRPAVDRVFKP